MPELWTTQSAWSVTVVTRGRGLEVSVARLGRPGIGAIMQYEGVGLVVKYRAA